MSRWTSTRAILRDLSQAQGGEAGEARPLAAAERPPRPRIHEETEEEYFEHCIGDGIVAEKPDLRLIQEMLKMVRDSNRNEDGADTGDVAVISKLNPSSAEFVPRAPKARSRNVALESILAMETASRADDRLARTESPGRTEPVSVILTAEKMFKRKRKPKAATSAEPRLGAAPAPAPAPAPARARAYVPGAAAAHYYSRYVSNSRLADQLHDDIWAKAEKQMRRIDERKRSEAAAEQGAASAAREC